MILIKISAEEWEVLLEELFIVILGSEVIKSLAVYFIVNILGSLIIIFLLVEE